MIVAVVRMAELVRDDAGDLVRAVGLLQQRVEQVDLAARQRDRVRDRARQHLRVERMLDAARGPELLDQFRERGLAFGRLADLAAEYRPHLQVDRLADPLLDRIRHQRRQPIGGVAAMPKTTMPRIDAIAAADQNTMRSVCAGPPRSHVERGAARDHGFDRRGVVDLETRQRRGGRAAQTQPVRRPVGAADLLERPGRDHGAVLDDVERRAKAQRDLMLAARRAVEIDGGALLHILHRHAPLSFAITQRHGS